MDYLGYAGKVKHKARKPAMYTDRPINSENNFPRRNKFRENCLMPVSDRDLWVAMQYCLMLDVEYSHRKWMKNNEEKFSYCTKKIFMESR